MDVEWRQNLFDGLASRIRFSRLALGALLRADDDLPAGDRFANTSGSAKFVERLDAPEDQVPGDRIHLWRRSDFHTSVFTGMVRFPQQARCVRRLFRKLHQGDEGAQAFLPILA